MTSLSFPLRYSLLSKAAILSAGIVCLLFIGWPVSQTRDRSESQSAFQKSTRVGEMANAGFSSSAQHEANAQSARINLNLAKVSDLESLPGIGSVLAQRIIDHRERHGPFKTLAALDTVPGIGKLRIAHLRPLVIVTLDDQHEKIVRASQTGS